MNKLNPGSLFPLAALLIVVFALDHQVGTIPPVGKILDPFVGFVQNDEDGQLTSSNVLRHLPGLEHPVQVFFDDRKVPHIYAENSQDLYFAQGYVTASLRLWQMDFLTYVTAGRMSELFSGGGYLDYDREQRRIGLMDAARRSLELIKKDTETSKVLDAYTRGVNAYINNLTYKKLPFEYKLFDYRPEPWSDLKTVLVFKQIANTLSGYEEDMTMSRLIMILGADNFNRLYPDFQSHITPVMNLSKPEEGKATANLKIPGYLNYSFLSSNSVAPQSSYNPRLGSNSWAVSGKRTMSGNPILACDPHLGLSLPSIWIEMQLTTPEMNVYGVAIPGTPAIDIGYNENIAWGITNGADDVKDWYKLKINYTYTKYEMDGKWLPLSYREEEIKIKGQRPFYDTIYSSVHGPVVYNHSFPGRHQELADYALRWELHNPSNEFATFIQLNKARNYQDYKKSIKEYHCPSLNFTFACKDNTISIDHQGRLPVKFPGQGKFVLDGTQSDLIYTVYIPNDSLPHLLNPPCQYVLSANQHPTYPNYPYYYNGYYSESRANEIQQQLQDGMFDIERMESIQLNNTNSFAVTALSVLLKKIEQDRLNDRQKRAFASVATWKGAYDLNDEYGELFSLWWQNITDYTWDEFNRFPYELKKPGDRILLDMIQYDPSDPYFDRMDTPEKENADDIVTQAFIAASAEFFDMNKNGMKKWGDINRVNIMHLTQLPAFSVMNIPSAGNPDAIDAISDNWGPSWRMVVELGKRPVGYGIYPGGQSGNPGSAYYSNFVKDWNKGKFYPLLFFISRNEAESTCKTKWTLQ